ncbi:MAG TPA: hypothetical protein VNG71_20455, partial [Pyrinomonadaceae bacterium]|nr:hypothetical protein [Pyrinomonadaceae bacterium]
KRQAHLKDLEKRVARIERIVSEEGGIGRLERLSVRLAAFIALLLWLLMVLIGKLADLIAFIIHLAVLGWHTVSK